MRDYSGLGSAFVTGWFQGALVMALALVLCGVLGRSCSVRAHARAAAVDATAEGARQTAARDLAAKASKAPPAKARKAPPAKRTPGADPGLRQAERWSRCSGPACYYDVGVRITDRGPGA